MALLGADGRPIGDDAPKASIAIPAQARNQMIAEKIEEVQRRLREDPETQALFQDMLVGYWIVQMATQTLMSGASDPEIAFMLNQRAQTSVGKLSAPMILDLLVRNVVPRLKESVDVGKKELRRIKKEVQNTFDKMAKGQVKMCNGQELRTCSRRVVIGDLQSRRLYFMREAKHIRELEEKTSTPVLIAYLADEIKAEHVFDMKDIVPGLVPSCCWKAEGSDNPEVHQVKLLELFHQKISKISKPHLIIIETAEEALWKDAFGFAGLDDMIQKWEPRSARMYGLSSASADEVSSLSGPSSVIEVSYDRVNMTLRIKHDEAESSIPLTQDELLAVRSIPSEGDRTYSDMYKEAKGES